MAQFDELLEGLKKLPPLQSREKTFMEIAGYPHFENVCSNILAFYLNPNNEHGFGTLLLDALARVINEEIKTNEQSIQVKREVITDGKKRIDLVIESDDYVLAIENKIFASIDNPFQDYSEYLEKLSKGRKIYKVLLSFHTVQESPCLYGFKPVGYEPFMKEVTKNIESYSLNALKPHLTFLEDFIQTMQNLRGKTSMDSQRLEYFHNNYQGIRSLLGEVDELRKDMRRRIKQLDTMIIAQKPSYLTQCCFWQTSTDLIDVVVYTIKLNESFLLELAICITPLGWKIYFWNLAAEKDKNGERHKIKELMDKQNVEVEETTATTGNVWRLLYKGEDEHQPYETDLEEIRIWTTGILNRLTTLSK
jgi:PD-(D/E)XK nuclease superfamily